MNELKVFIEGCVRPVWAEGSKKLAMRRELYSHLYTVYEQERQHTENDAAAAEAAIARMGDPNQLTAELNASLSWFDRWTGYSEQMTVRRIDESPWQYGMRSIRFASIFSAALFVPLGTILLLVSNKSAFQQQWMLVLLGAIFVTESLGSMPFAWSFATLRDQLEQHGWHRQTYMLIAGISALLMIVIPSLGWLFFYAVSGDAIEAVAFLPRWLLLAVFAAPLLAWAAWLDAKLTRDLREWLELSVE